MLSPQTHVAWVAYLTSENAQYAWPIKAETKNEIYLSIDRFNEFNAFISNDACADCRQTRILYNTKKSCINCKSIIIYIKQ